MAPTLSLPSKYTSIHLAKRPTSKIVPGETFYPKSDNSTPNPSSLPPDHVLFQTLYLSLDPAMRGWLNDTRSYIPPVAIDAVMRGGAVGRVVASTCPQTFPVGSLATSNAGGWTEYAVLPSNTLEKVEVPSHGKVTDALGVLGLTGLTAYFGLLKIGDPKPGDFVVVSGAAGATGSVVGQIAKIKGATVLGIAGADDKCRWLTEELGFDLALNYKSPNFAKEFRDATRKRLIDVYFDNVGGEILDLALSRAKEHSRFVMCGGISQYNTSEPRGPKNYLMIVSMRIKMQGFVVFDFEKEYSAARRELAKWLEEGKIQRKETVVKGGITNAEKALVDLYDGKNTGKMMVEIRDPAQEWQQSAKGGKL